MLLPSLLLLLSLLPSNAEESSQTQENAQNYYDSSSTVQNYKSAWGKGNIHFGYYYDADLKNFSTIPSGAAATELFSSAAHDMTLRVASKLGLDSGSRLLDLGCGFGKPLTDICLQYPETTGIGLDITPSHVADANERAKKHPELKLSFEIGSFLAIPEVGRITHVTSNVAFCHLHAELEGILKEAYRVLEPGGVLVAVDFLGKKEVSERARKYVYERLKFTELRTHEEYRGILEGVGFLVREYDVLDDHLCYGYALLEASARHHGGRSANGNLLADDYKETVVLCREGEVGMNLFVAVKPEVGECQAEEACEAEEDSSDDEEDSDDAFMKAKMGRLDEYN